MQTVARLFAEFVARTLGQKAPTTAVTVDTQAEDQAWWDQQLAQLEDEHWEKLGNWYCEEVTVKCSFCQKSFTIQRWQQCGDGEEEECGECADAEQARYEDFLAACEADG